MKKVFEGKVKEVIIHEVYDLHGQILDNNPKEFPNGKSFKDAQVLIKKHKNEVEITINGEKHTNIYSMVSTKEKLIIKECTGWG